jgi:hypothetical protein
MDKRRRKNVERLRQTISSVTLRSQTLFSNFSHLQSSTFQMIWHLRQMEQEIGLALPEHRCSPKSGRHILLF